METENNHDSKTEAGRAKIPVPRLVIRPGSGWNHMKGPVWEHTSGVRIHVSGRLVKFAGKEARNLYQIPYAFDLWFLLQKINGNNPKRAMMALALNISV